MPPAPTPDSGAGALDVSPQFALHIGFRLFEAVAVNGDRRTLTDTLPPCSPIRNLHSIRKQGVTFSATP